MQRIINLYTGLPCYQADIKGVTAIEKFPVSTALYVDRTGLPGDGVGDVKRHGGIERVVHQYPAENYRHWLTLFNIQSNASIFQPSLFGENISSLGMKESETYIGDIYRIGSTLLQVSQPRKPCWKLNWKAGLPNASILMQMNGLTGWFYRVIEPGYIKAGDSILLIERMPQQMSIKTIVSELYGEAESPMYKTMLNEKELHAIADNQLLSDNWRKVALDRLSTGNIESWQHRLYGPSTVI